MELEGLGYSKNMVILFIFSSRKKGWRFLESWAVATTHGLISTGLLGLSLCIF